MNATQHASVVDADETTAADLQVHIRQLLADLAELLPLIHALREGRQRGRGFLTQEGRKVLDRQVRAERRDLRLQPEHRDHSGHVIVGLKFLNRTTQSAGTGETHDLGTSRGIVVEADIAFTLTDQIHRLETRRQRPGIEVDPIRFPAPVSEPTLGDLIVHLIQLVACTPSVKALTPVLRDIEPLVEQARLAVHGHDRTLLPEPCPYCGVTSLVRYLDEGRTVCEADPRAASKIPHPCVCPDAMCDCKRNPRTHRHEWFDNPKNKTQRHVLDLHGLINHQKEVAVMETRALDAIVAIRELHAPVKIQPLAVECPVYDDPEVDHSYDAGDNGEELCWTCPTITLACGHCTHPDDEELTLHPCPTLQHLVDIDVPAPTRKGRK